MADARPWRRPSILNRVLGSLAWLALLPPVAWLAFAYALPQWLTETDPPYARLAAVAFFGRVFTFHLGLIVALIAAVAVPLRRWRLTTVATVIAAVSLWPTLLACLPRHPPPPAGPAVRVMAMNVKYTNGDAADMVAQVRRFNPDVLTVEEFGRPPRRALDAALTADYPFRSLKSGAGIGLGIYSRLPFEDGPPQLSFGGHRRQIRCVLRLNDRRVALYVLHPLSPRSVARVVENRLATADLADQLAHEPLPVILAGDFNFTAETPNAAALRAAGLTDAFDLAGRGRGSTWPALPRWAARLPGVRIDHVYLSPGLTCCGYATGGFTGSDHYPVVADLAVARRP